MAIEKVSASNVDLDTKDLLYAAVDDISDLRAKLTALLEKLDADTGLDDDDYASTLAVATQKLTS